jgi:acetyltransferase-like isoleucine patch superfamily enzyme
MATSVGNNVWIGAGAVILPGAEIADGVIVSPNSVVSGMVAANAIVQGNPAKTIFTRR